MEVPVLCGYKKGLLSDRQTTHLRHHYETNTAPVKGPAKIDKYIIYIYIFIIPSYRQVRFVSIFAMLYFQSSLMEAASLMNDIVFDVFDVFFF